MPSKRAKERRQRRVNYIHEIEEREMSKRQRNSPSSRSYPVSRWRQSRVEPTVTLIMECVEEPLSYSQYQAAKAAKAEYHRNQQIIAAAKQGRLMFTSDGRPRILDKPFAEMTELQDMFKMRPLPPPPPPRVVVTLPTTPVAPMPTSSPLASPQMTPSQPADQAQDDGRESPDIIFVGESPPAVRITPLQVVKRTSNVIKEVSPRAPPTRSPANEAQLAASRPKASNQSPSLVSRVPANTKPELDKKRTSKKPSQSQENIGTADTNMMPLDEYYYGKTEGNPAYVEEKGEFRFKCFYCNKMLYNNVAAMLHIQGHIDTDRQVNLDISVLTQCKHCFKQFDTPFEMQTHIERVHLNRDNTLLCRICDKDCTSRQVLTDHMRKSHNACEMPYICQLCKFRSSMYNDVVDHFKKKHSCSQYILCLYCLRVFSARIMSQGHCQTNAFFNHLVKHQVKQSTKKCHHCKLIFLNSAELKVHRMNDHMPNQKGVRATHTKHSTPADQVMINVATETVNPRTSGGAIKSLNVPTIKKVIEQRIWFPYSAHSAECKECGTLFGSTDHFSKYIQCSLCRFATSCSFAYANHMMSFHSGQSLASPIWSAEERQLAAVLFCGCGFSSHYGNVIATHLVSCSKTSCSTEAPMSHSVPVDEFGRKLKDPRKKPGASLLDVLGLVKKDSFVNSSVVRPETSSPPPPVEMPEVSMADPPPRRPSLLKDALKKSSFKTILQSDSKSFGDSETKMSASENSPSPSVDSTSSSTTENDKDVTKKREAESSMETETSQPKKRRLSTKVVEMDEGSTIQDVSDQNADKNPNEETYAVVKKNKGRVSEDDSTRGVASQEDVDKETIEEKDTVGPDKKDESCEGDGSGDGSGKGMVAQEDDGKEGDKEENAIVMDTKDDSNEGHMDGDGVDEQMRVGDEVKSGGVDDSVKDDEMIDGEDEKVDDAGLVLDDEKKLEDTENKDEKTEEGGESVAEEKLEEKKEKANLVEGEKEEDIQKEAVEEDDLDLKEISEKPEEISGTEMADDHDVAKIEKEVEDDQVKQTVDDDEDDHGKERKDEDGDKGMVEVLDGDKDEKDTEKEIIDGEEERNMAGVVEECEKMVTNDDEDEMLGGGEKIFVKIESGSQEKDIEKETDDLEKGDLETDKEQVDGAGEDLEKLEEGDKNNDEKGIDDENKDDESNDQEKDIEDGSNDLEKDDDENIDDESNDQGKDIEDGSNDIEKGDDDDDDDDQESNDVIADKESSAAVVRDEHDFDDVSNDIDKSVDDANDDEGKETEAIQEDRQDSEKPIATDDGSHQDTVKVKATEEAEMEDDKSSEETSTSLSAFANEAEGNQKDPQILAAESIQSTTEDKSEGLEPSGTDENAEAKQAQKDVASSSSSSSVDRSKGEGRSRSRERERERERDRERDRDRDRHRDRDRDYYRDGDRYDRDRYRDDDRRRDRHRDYDRSRDKDRSGYDRHRDRDRSRERDRNREWHRERDRSRDRYRGHDRHRDRDYKDRDDRRNYR